MFEFFGSQGLIFMSCESARFRYRCKFADVAFYR